MQSLRDNLLLQTFSSYGAEEFIREITKPEGRLEGKVIQLSYGINSGLDFAITLNLGKFIKSFINLLS